MGSKEYVWQRLYKRMGDHEVYSVLSDHEHDPDLLMSDEDMKFEGNYIWLCPEPVKVLRRWYRWEDFVAIVPMLPNTGEIFKIDHKP